ncbi:hypothetical protein GOODEAATRI_014925 [Goodea atripinnis]|uniref:Arginine vasotocin receptor n=1 Tax=Goodea atripinnis TaxID=208336 RepID=A0ABV0PYN5_9TELE
MLWSRLLPCCRRRWNRHLGVSGAASRVQPAAIYLLFTSWEWAFGPVRRTPASPAHLTGGIRACVEGLAIGDGSQGKAGVSVGLEMCEDVEMGRKGVRGSGGQLSLLK